MVVEKAADTRPEDGSLEEKWMVIQFAITEAADEVLGRVINYHPDWFRDSMDQLKQLLDKRNAVYIQWQRSQRHEHHLEFKEASKERDKKGKEQVVPKN